MTQHDTNSSCRITQLQHIVKHYMKYFNWRYKLELKSIQKIVIKI